MAIFTHILLHIEAMRIEVTCANLIQSPSRCTSATQGLNRVCNFIDRDHVSVRGGQALKQNTPES